MAARELTLRSKELMTVSRVRMLKENRAKNPLAGRLNLTDKDVAKIGQWIEDDAVSQDIYQERLDTLLSLGSQADKEAIEAVGLTQAGQELMNIWSEMDRGKVKPEEALTKADEAVRRKAAGGRFAGVKFSRLIYGIIQKQRRASDRAGDENPRRVAVHRKINPPAGKVRRGFHQERPARPQDRRQQPVPVHPRRPEKNRGGEENAGAAACWP